MITDLRYVGSNGIILEGKLNQKEIQVKFQDILPFWEYATEEDLEGGTAKIFGNKILFTMLTASTQGGVVVLWNAETGKVEHISDGSYALAIDMDQQYIYVLLDVFNYVTRANLQLWKIPIGSMNAYHEGEKMDVEILPSADFSIDDYYKYNLTKYPNKFEINLNGEIYSVAIK